MFLFCFNKTSGSCAPEPGGKLRCLCWRYNTHWLQGIEKSSWNGARIPSLVARPHSAYLVTGIDFSELFLVYWFIDLKKRILQLCLLLLLNAKFNYLFIYLPGHGVTDPNLWVQNCYVAQNGLELLILLLRPPECWIYRLFLLLCVYRLATRLWVYRRALLLWVCAVLGSKSRSISNLN